MKYEIAERDMTISFSEVFFIWGSCPALGKKSKKGKSRLTKVIH